MAFLIPVPDDTANIYAAVKPFQWPIWLLLAISTVFVILVLKQLIWFYNYWKNKAVTRGANRSEKTANSQNHLSLYVFGKLMSQGGLCNENRLSFRIVAGVWVLAAFVFVQAYQSTLITYVMAPITSPLINSAYDIAESTDITLLMKKEGTLESLIKSSNKTLYRKLQARIGMGCAKVSECISQIQPGSRNVYADAKSFQREAITENFKQTGKYNLQLTRDDFINMMATFALPKNSPYTDSISIGLLEIREIGLNQYWDLWYPPVAHHCLKNMKKGNIKSSTSEKPPALTLKNLTGAFLILLVGVGLSLCAFLWELVFSITIIVLAQ